MQLLLIRHALPVRTEGAADPPLSPEGLQQAARLAAFLRTEPLDAIYSSPLRRAQQTAAPLAARLGLGVEVRDGLAEWDRDADSYIPVEELRETDHPVWQALASDDFAALGIDLHAFRTRVDDAVAGIVAAHPGQSVAVVCHGGVINSYTARVLGIDRVLWCDPGYTSITRVLASRGGDRNLTSLNERGHLRVP